jgi:hypothetical protein
MPDSLSNEALEKQMIVRVLLDTCTVRKTLHQDADRPNVALVQQHLDYCKISIAGLAFSELTEQLLDERIPFVDWQTGSKDLKEIIDPKWPLFPSGKQLAWLAGTQTSEPCDINFVQAHLKAVWYFLCAADSLTFLLKKDVVFLAPDRSRHKFGLTKERLDKVMRNERDFWIGCVKNIQRLQADQSVELDESKILRLMAKDLASRSGDPAEMLEKLDTISRMVARLFALSLGEKSPYNPGSEKGRGDAFDLDLLFAIPLPAVIVTADERFANRLHSTKAPHAEQVCTIPEFHTHLRSGLLASLVRRFQTQLNQFRERQVQAYRLWESRGGPFGDNWRDWYDAEPVSRPRQDRSGTRPCILNLIDKVERNALHMATSPTSPEPLADRVGRAINRWLRLAKYQWLNARLLADVSVAVVLFVVVFLTTTWLPREASPPNSGAGFTLAFFASLPPMLMVGSFWYVRRYLKGEAAYEDLRAAKRPSLVGFFEWFLRFPCSAVVLFALLTGIALAAWGCGGWGPAVRTSMMQVTAPLPPVATAIISVVGQEAAPWPRWVDFVLSVVFAGVVFALVAAWFERGTQRQNYVASLFAEEDRRGTAYGVRSGNAPDDSQPEPHEQVLLMQGGRIGAACLPYLRVELSGSEWTTEPVMIDRCRGAVAALERVFGVNEKKEFDSKRGEAVWQAEPLASTYIADWLLAHLGRLVYQDRSFPNPAFDHRLGEAVVAVAVVLASGQSLPSRPTPTSGGAYHDPDRVGKFRAHILHLFSISPKRPTLLIAACEAAERLATPEDLKVLDAQTRRLDVQAGFTILQTDRILQTRDRVLAREPLRSELMARLIKRIEGLGMERLPDKEGKPFQFRRERDGAVMVLVVAGSFCRGDDHAEETSPRRRVHLGSYLIDLAPVSQDSFKRWVEAQGSVLRVERGFFPVQGLPDDVPQDRPYASHVTWFAAQAYAQWVVAGGHLPTEAQWEKAARGTEDDRRYPSGTTWVDEPDSPFGIRLCHLLEWTEDAYDRLAYRRSPVVFDPRMESAASAGDEAMRVIRGRTPGSPVGSYSLVTRPGMEPVTGAFTAPVGFRVVVDLEQEPQV